MSQPSDARPTLLRVEDNAMVLEPGATVLDEAGHAGVAATSAAGAPAAKVEAPRAGRWRAVERFPPHNH